MWQGNFSIRGEHMRYLVFDNYKVVVDYDKNYEYYFSPQNSVEYCSCPACRNFKPAVEKHCPASAISFFNDLGISIQRANQLIPYNGVNKKIVTYGGYFHCCGSILSNEYLTETITISDAFKISFQKECDLKNDKMPSPTFQINFKIDLPWVLNEDNIYCWSPKTSRQRRLSI